MIVYALYNNSTGEYFVRNRSYYKSKWTKEFKKASVWTSKIGPIAALKANKSISKDPDVYIKEFSLTEINKWRWE